MVMQVGKKGRGLELQLSRCSQETQSLLCTLKAPESIPGSLSRHRWEKESPCQLASAVLSWISGPQPSVQDPQGAHEPIFRGLSRAWGSRLEKLDTTFLGAPFWLGRRLPHETARPSMFVVIREISLAVGLSWCVHMRGMKSLSEGHVTPSTCLPR